MPPTKSELSNLVIREANLQDLQEVTEVLTHSFHSSPNWLRWTYPLLKLGIYEDLRGKLRVYPPYYQCLVAVTKSADNPALEKIVGTVEVSLRSFWSWPGWELPHCYISNLAVSSHYRRCGIARQLLSRCEQRALSWGDSVISLHVLDNNHQAKKLYLAHGYQIQRIESSLSHWLWQQPKRLLLQKEIKII